MTAREELVAARNELYEAIKSHLQKYEERTGLRIDEIAIDRPFEMIGVDRAPMTGIKVRTNASSL